MTSFKFTCPVAVTIVQAWAVDEPAVAAEFYEALECPACKGVHLVNPRTGKVVGSAFNSRHTEPIRD